MYTKHENFDTYPNTLDISFDEMKALIDPIINKLKLDDNEVTQVSLVIEAPDIVNIELALVRYSTPDDLGNQRPIDFCRVKYSLVSNQDFAIKIHEEEIDNRSHSVNHIVVGDKEYSIDKSGEIPRVISENESPIAMLRREFKEKHKD